MYITWSSAQIAGAAEAGEQDEFWQNRRCPITTFGLYQTKSVHQCVFYGKIISPQDHQLMLMAVIQQPSYLQCSVVVHGFRSSENILIWIRKMRSPLDLHSKIREYMKKQNERRVAWNMLSLPFPGYFLKVGDFFDFFYQLLHVTNQLMIPRTNNFPCNLHWWTLHV